MTTIIESRLQEYESVHLERGKHKSPDEGGCLLEWTSWLAGEPWSDHPVCVSPVIAAFLRRWQDDLDDDRAAALPELIAEADWEASRGAVDAAGAADGAAWDADGAALAPTVRELQASAHGLVERMIEVQS